MVNIWTDSDYVYVATTSGLDIINVEDGQRASFSTRAEGYNTVWSDDAYVFVGSDSGGVQVLSKSSIGPAEISGYIVSYANYPFLTSDTVRYIHGNTTKLICCTSAGVDIIRRDSNYITHTSIVSAEPRKCFVTPNHNYYYYTVEDQTNLKWYLNRLNGNTSDWLYPDKTYVTGSGFLELATCINDFFVTEHTAVSGINNTLFVATISGVYVFDEETSDYFLFTTVS